MWHNHSIRKKNTEGDAISSESYRGITLSPVIGKLFESLIMESCNTLLHSDALQFGVKKNSSCTNAIYILRTVVEYYCNNDCTVSTCALDISKAFNHVDQYTLLNLMIDRGIPKCIISLMLDWFKKSTVMVRQGNSLSKKIIINASVRQGGLLSPIFFAIYVDTLIQKFK